MVNRVILIGNLGRDPEVRRLDNGVAVAKFPIATNENYKDKAGNWQTQTEWHDIVVWRESALRAETSLKKGMAVYVEGKLTHRTWQDQEGNNRRTTEVVASYFRIISRPDSSSTGSSGYAEQEPVSGDNDASGDDSENSLKEENPGMAPDKSDDVDHSNDKTDDLPF